jgi:hypothetical protein
VDELPVPEEAVEVLELRSLRGGSEARKGFEDLVRLVLDLCRCSPSEVACMGKTPTSPDAIIVSFMHSVVYRLGRKTPRFM